MKNMQMIIMLIISLFVSCSEQNNDIDKIENPLKGEWNLKQISGGFSESEQYNNGDVVFHFTENDSVNIKFGIVLENSSKFPFTSDTVLYYEYDSVEIIIGDFEFEYVIADSLLKLIDNLASDGIMLELKK